MSGKRNDCPVTEQGCPPVIELTANMKWLVWGAKLSILQFFGIVAALLVFLFKLGLGHIQGNALAEQGVENTVQSPRSEVQSGGFEVRGAKYGIRTEPKVSSADR